MDELPTAVDEFIEAVKKLKQDSDRKDALHKQEEQEWRTQGEKLQNRMETMQAKYSAEKDKLANQTRALQKLEAEILRLKSSLQTSEQLLASAGSKIENKGLNITKLETKLAAANTKASEANTRISGLEQEKITLNKKLEEREKVVQTLRNSYRDLNESHNISVRQSEEEIKIHTQANEVLQKRVVESEKRMKLLQKKIENHKFDILDAEEAVRDAKNGQNAANRKVRELSDQIQKLKSRIKDLIAENKKHQEDLAECLKHKTELTTKAKALEAEEQKQKKAEEKQKRSEKALNKIKNTDGFKGGPKNPTRRKSIPAPRLRGPQVRKMVLTHEQIREKIRALEKLQRKQVEDRRERAELLNIQRGTTLNGNQKKKLKEIKERLKTQQDFYNQIKDLEEQDKDLNFIDDEIERIKNSLENTRERWAKFQDKEDFENFIQNIKSYEYNKRDGVEIDSPRLKKLDKALEKLEMKEAPKFFQEVIDGKFDKLLGEVTGTSEKTGNPQGPIKRNNPDFQIRLRF